VRGGLQRALAAADDREEMPAGLVACASRQGADSGDTLVKAVEQVKQGAGQGHGEGWPRRGKGVAGDAFAFKDGTRDRGSGCSGPTRLAKESFQIKAFRSDPA